MPVRRRRESEGRDRQVFPTFSYNFCEGTQVAAAEVLRGKIVVLFFSSEWCPACKLFVPTLCAAPQTHHAEPQAAAVACTLLVAPSPLCSRDRPGTRCTSFA